MRTHTGVPRRMFAALAAMHINMKMITTGDIKISVLVGQVRWHASAAGRSTRHSSYMSRGWERDGASAARARRSPIPNGPAEAVHEPADRDLAAVTQHRPAMEDIVVSDVLLATDQGRITIFDLPTGRGTASTVFQAVAAGGIVVDMIVQNLNGSGPAELSFSVPRADLDQALQLTQKVARDIDKATRVAADADIAKLVCAGRRHADAHRVARRMFGALAERGIISR